MGVVRLRTVDGFIAFDLDDVATSVGGVRLAPDLDEDEVRLLARAMTYKFAVLGFRIGGAKVGLRAGAAERDEVLRRFCEEVRPLVRSRRLMVGPDLGTHDHDFRTLRTPGSAPRIMDATVDGTPFEDILTGFGVVAAADAALGGLDGTTVAVEGFGKVGGGVAREVARRGGRLVAVSTIEGCVVEPGGFDVDRLWKLRAEHGDGLVRHAGPPVRPPGALFEVGAGVLVPGARTGVLDRRRAARLAAEAVVPAANVPYTRSGLDTLRARGIAAYADFVCNAGGILGYLREEVARAPTTAAAAAAVEAVIGGLVARTRDDPAGPFAAACRIAESFLETWRGPNGLPPGPPLA